jgi:hypothetical protein
VNSGDRLGSPKAKVVPGGDYHHSLHFLITLLVMSRDLTAM